MDPQRIIELAKLLRQNGDKILSSEFTLTLSGSLLRALNDSFTLIGDTVEIGSLKTNFEVVQPNNSISPVFRDLQLIYDFIQKTTLLRIVHFPGEESFNGVIDISKFRSLQRLEVQKICIKQVTGIQGLRAQLKELICIKALHSIDEVITLCAGDNSNGFVWNELKMADFSYNSLQTIDSALEFAQYLQHLNLRHNQLVSASAIKWLPHLKILDLSFNRLTSIPQLHIEANKRLQTLNLSNNYVEDLMNLTKLEALTELDLSDNCLLDHSTLLPISALITLRYLNLVGNPLHCHPKHRLAAAQFLHKNTATVKFVLDFEPLSKHEKAITGTHQLRVVGSLNSYTSTSSAKSISAANLTPTTSMHTPSSSFGSIRAYKIQDTSTDGEQQPAQDVMTTSSAKKRYTKMRTVEIEEHTDETRDASTSINTRSNKLRGDILEQATTTTTTTTTTIGLMFNDNEHLAAQKQADDLREKHGADWLKFRKTPAKNMHSSMSAVSNDATAKVALGNDYLGELSAISTPTHAILPATVNNVSPIEKIQYNEGLSHEETTLYVSARESQQQPSLYISTTPQEEVSKAEENEHLRDIYSGKATLEEPEISEPEDDEATYIVYNSKNPNVSIFLTISSNFLREKDAITQHTKAKWSLKILESCERISANTFRINFDTVKLDKQERIYIVEEDLCQELERTLRNILAQRNLTEMNQIMYRCVSCSCQFSQETKIYKTSYKKNEVRCPDCKSNFVAIIQEIPPPAPVNDDTTNLSPASIVQVSPTEDVKPIVEVDDTTSIGSATSLNEESSSCSKLTNSQNSFDSNQSVVGSSNTDREQDFKSIAESEVEIISNPSISSIEVLDQNLYTASRKTSEERRTLFTPNLPTIDDHSFTQSCIERYYNRSAGEDKELVIEYDASTVNDTNMDMKKHTLNLPNNKTIKSTHNQHMLTESSSSGSVTDSVCTAYEQQHAHDLEKVELTQHMLMAEAQHSNNNTTNNNKSDNNTNNNHNDETTLASPDSDVPSLFGAFLQSTNLLMTSSKKQLKNNQQIQQVNQNNNCQPYKFNYTDFKDVDHRLKLYLYQNKFKDESERIKWIVKGRIFNANTKNLWPGVLVMSTCKFYVFEAIAIEHDDVGKWLRQIISVTVDRLESIQLLPWKLGLHFHIRDWGNFLLLLQDILRTDSLLLYFANNALPGQCKVHYQPEPKLVQQLSVAVMNEKLSMCSLINGCVVSCDSAKRSFNVCCLLTTDTRLCLTSDNLSWLEDATSNEIELCLTQYMSNLVEVESSTPHILAFNFLDETENKCELWTCTFETQENAESCLNAISQSWEKLFGVSLVTA